MRKIISIGYKWFINNKKSVYLIIILFAIIKFIYLNYLNWNYGTLCTGYGGIQYGCDSKRYLEGAENLIKGKGIMGYRNAYVGYMTIIALGRVLGLGLEFTLVFQIIVTLLASIAFYDLIQSITKSKTAGILGASFYLSSPYIATWVLFIHTESLYSSMLVISVWTLNKSLQNQTFKNYLILCCTIFFTATLRPNGWSLIPISLFFIIQYSNLILRSKIIIYLTLSIGFLLIMNYSPWFSKKRELDGLHQLISKGQIICDKETFHLTMPKETFTNNNDLIESFTYIVKHPISFVKLACLRVVSELFPIYRPWLTIKFIIRFNLWMLPAYFFTLVSLFFIKKLRGLKIILTFLFAHLLIIAFSFSEREFRFLTQMLPLFYLAGTCGFYFMIQKLVLKNR
jgi:hypothetical protein